jgi:hypothetical protein
VIAFAAAIATSGTAAQAASEAAAKARSTLGEVKPVLAIAFASPSYDGLDGVPAAIDKELGPLPIAGGTAGGAVFDQSGVASRGVLVVLVGGDGVRAATATARIASPELIDVVPAGARLLVDADSASADGFEEALCLAFAPSPRVDGEAFVAAVRKGTATRMQLAGALTGDDFTFDRARVFADGGAHSDRVNLMGVFTRTPVGIAARHGWCAAGPPRVVTRSDGQWLVALDGRRAVDAWLADVRAAEGRPPSRRSELLAFLANHWQLGIDVPSQAEPIVRAPVRAPMALRDDGAVLLSGAIAEGTLVRIMHASPEDMLRAAHEAAVIARERVGGQGQTSGVLLLACSARLAALGERFPEEPAAVARALDAPLAGACVFGEIALAHREVDAFHNTTAVVVAWPR